MTISALRRAKMGSDRPTTSRTKSAAKALDDLANGMRRVELWSTLGWNDIRQRYRRSTIGPFWLTISMGAMIGGMGVLYGALLKQPIDEYLPYLAVGIIVWGLIAGLTSDACYVFIGAEDIIKQQPCPFSVHIYRVIWRNFIVFLHNAAIYAVILLTFSVDIGFYSIISVFGLFILYLNSISICILFGLISLRFRDFPPIVGVLIQLAFFMTPIIWKADQLPENMSFIVYLNPFYYLLSIVRDPLLGQTVSPMTWLTAAIVTAVGGLLAFVFYSKFRGRIAYWV